MSYMSILDKPSLEILGLTILQTAVIFCFVLFGLKIVGRRVFGEQSPQDLILLLIVAEACDIGLTPEDAGFWGTMASVSTILLLGWLCDKIVFVRKAIDGKPVIVFSNGHLNKKVMKKFMIDEADLALTARTYGLETFKQFRIIILEGDGKITGIVDHSIPANEPRLSQKK
jgi:uncharacterized membrane protein YcaP (DUF421 family)